MNVAYIPSEVVAKAREMDLLTYLQNYEPQELVKVSSRTYSTRTHDSISISNGKWYWHSQGIGATSALSYLIKVRGMHLPDAVEQLLGQTATQPPLPASEPLQPKENPKAFMLPPKSQTNKRMVAYLQSRGIDPGIIKHCYDLGLLYESSPYGNAVFVGRDKTGTAATPPCAERSSWVRWQEARSDIHLVCQRLGRAVSCICLSLQ